MDAAHDDRWLLLAAITGMLAIVALPLSTVFAGSDDAVGRLGVSVLAFATPATLFVAGRLHARASFYGGGTIAVIGGFAAAAIGPAGVAVLVVVAAGAGLAVTIRRLSRVAPTSNP